MGIFDNIRKDLGSIFSTPTTGISTFTSNGRGKKKGSRYDNMVDSFRPVENNPYSTFSNDAAKIPNLPLGLKFCYDLHNFNDVIRTIVRSLVQETFRNGMAVTPRFALKCTVCKYEYDTEIQQCEQCGSENFRKPDQDEKRQLEEKMKDVNYNDETLKEVLINIDTDINIIDNAYIVCRKEYGFSADGKAIQAEVKEILRGAPIAIKLVQNQQGRYGRTDDGLLCLFCLDHRDIKYEIKEEELDAHPEKWKCPKCELDMYPCYFVYDQTGYVTPLRAGIKKVYFTNGEVLHIKKFSNNIGYGFPPILSVWTKCLILMKMDWFILQAYNLQRPPKGMLVMKATRESVQKSWEKIKEEARINPYMIYPLVVEPDGKDAKTVAEWVDFSFKSDDIEFIEYRNELRRAIGALYGVSPLFQADTSTGIGLSNEGLQLTVTNRAVEAEQALFNEKVLEWVVKQWGITDWKIIVNPNEEKDQTAKLQRESMRADLAIKLATNFGVIPKIKKTADGIDFDFEDPNEIDRLIVEIKAFAVKNKVQLDPEQIKMMLTGQGSPLAATSNIGGVNQHQQAGGGAMGGGGGQQPGSLVGVTDGKGGVTPPAPEGAHNPEGENEKNPLNETMTPREQEQHAEGEGFSGRPRKDPLKSRWEGDSATSSGVRKRKRKVVKE